MREIHGRRSTLGGRTRRSRPQAEDVGLYSRLSAAYRAYTDDVPEDAFPTFLEALLLEEIDARQGVGSRRVTA